MLNPHSSPYVIPKPRHRGRPRLGTVGAWLPWQEGSTKASGCKALHSACAELSESDSGCQEPSLSA